MIHKQSVNSVLSTLLLVMILALLTTGSTAHALTIMPPKDGERIPPHWNVPVLPSFEKDEPVDSSEDMRIGEIVPMKGGLYAEVSLEFRHAVHLTGIRVSIDGREVNARRADSIYSGSGASLKVLVFPGKPGKKTITVAGTILREGRTVKATREFDWKGEPYVVLADHFGKEELVQSPAKLRVIAANAGDVGIFFNGEKVHAEVFGNDAVLYTVQPVWAAGKNELRIVAKTSGGITISRVYTFVYTDKGRLAQGDSMFVGLDASIRGKSGPWFDLKIEGDSVSAAKRGERTIVRSLTPDGWLLEDEKTAVQLTAVKPGRSIVRIMRHARFLPEPEVEQEFVLQVIQPEK